MTKHAQAVHFVLPKMRDWEIEPPTLGMENSP